ncbi:Sua5/YciO/YrdC/YwlC family protein (plasmid) [Cupriavidus pinatubonensis]|uniref:Sua5/YciO/YrdC/YwlC family protein n=1 Tax=Cupriavidus pinatubonensis TaxID=248026 RepID=UPI001C7373F8|nr:Sua5/YciO/YrdC/YwlC family protein [Cupriavidus pinatubonensis]QYY33853.1 Sua5/YciO/YrdC/YwlC family protein [Cupriavidus pinatubonensis]
MDANVLSNEIELACKALREERVIAYPTESVFGLGCNPLAQAAVQEVFALKNRSPGQGFLLIGSSFDQVAPYIDFNKIAPSRVDAICAQWPGPSTWIFPASSRVPAWLVGRHTGIALRVTAHPVAADICRTFGGPIVSTSANPHGLPPATSASRVREYFDDRLGAIINGELGGAERPTPIRDALTGEYLRI